MIEGGIFHEIKNKAVLRGLMDYVYDATLKEVIEYIIDSHGLYFTESYRPQRHRNDLHGTIPVRAADLRDRVYLNPGFVVDDINAKFIYDPDRPHMVVAYWHGEGKNKHIHIQVCSKTRLKNESYCIKGDNYVFSYRKCIG